ncbi:hypothetical protein M758_6G106700 [Ceratodon purpureus]|uniref:Uncharacterized protein n=1 Tax=Ceratodon purpureus TaxID=3225 RepID=A0A8T0HD68_CERPU|nr:hypothetical protein KC19_6G110300 [Ceratodon purpureus]KAG0613487.1 hypothetical protein M758_6G106700 [Ceratodon purpureus]
MRSALPALHTCAALWLTQSVLAMRRWSLTRNTRVGVRSAVVVGARKSGNTKP